MKSQLQTISYCILSSQTSFGLDAKVAFTTRAVFSWGLPRLVQVVESVLGGLHILSHVIITTSLRSMYYSPCIFAEVVEI